MLYLDVSAYQNLSKQTLEVLGEPGISDLSISGAAPYWRAAFEYDLGDQSFEVGTFGIFANELPGRVPGFGSIKFWMPDWTPSTSTSETRTASP